MNKKTNELIEQYIENDNRKKLWELAFKYKNTLDLDKIVNYFIKVKDSFYICELISILPEDLNLEDIFNKIISTNDKTFMFWILKSDTIKSIIDYKYFFKLEKACNKLD